MTARNRNKSDKNIASVPDDKRSTKHAPAAGPSAFMKFISALFYVTLAGGAALASLYFYQALSEMKVMNGRHKESAETYAETTRDVTRALQQIGSVKASLQGLESAVTGVKADLQTWSRAVERGESETRRLEEMLQNLQDKILRDLKNGIQEVKDAREQDVSSLERTLQDRLSQLSRSISESVEEFAEEQSRYRNDLQELKTRVEEQQQTPASLKQELTSIRSAVANLNTASEVAEGNVDVLREQIAAVGAELQTRNKEVASVSEEIDAVRSLVRSTVGTLREEVSAARTGTQDASERLQALSDTQERSGEALQTLETQLREKLLKMERRREDVEAKLKVTEESVELLTSSLSEHTNRLDALISQHESQQSSLKNSRTSAEREILILRDDLEEMRSSLSDIQTSVRLETLEQKLRDDEGLEEPQDHEKTVDSTSEHLNDVQINK